MAPDPNEDTIDMIFSGSAGGTPLRRSGYEEARGDSPLSGQYSRHEQGGYQDDEAQRRARWQATPFYLPPASGGGGGGAGGAIDDADIDNIPIIRLTSADLDGTPGGSRSKKGSRRKSKKGDRHSRHHHSSSSGSLPTAEVMKEEMMPEGAVDSGGEEAEK